VLVPGEVRPDTIEAGVNIVSLLVEPEDGVLKRLLTIGDVRVCRLGEGYVFRGEGIRDTLAPDRTDVERARLRNGEDTL
jgi:hypothetical protein